MLFMVVERFKDRDAKRIYRRLRQTGRSMPDGLNYIDSWVEPNLDRCFQLMETDDLRLLQRWVAGWSDLIEFEMTGDHSCTHEGYTERVASVYSLKPRFQGVLLPFARMLAHAGVKANHVTLLACALSVATGLVLTAHIEVRRLLLILPVFLFLRMAMNAIDGMLAREFGQESDLGAYLNELTDVVSDAFLYLPFAYLPFEPLWIAAVILLAAISEMAGTVAAMTGASRRYDGPMGKSDRALAFGAMAAWIGFGGSVVPWVSWLFPRLMVLFLAATIVNRIRNGLAEKKTRSVSSVRC
jgi:CDP-diacylglycerol--glycerol-3-phosphate 3-phosphatidyltransferase